MMLYTWGSSPLTRGKLGTPTVGVVKIGLIPAHAGKTWRRGAGRPTRRAHPRSRGENHCILIVGLCIAGSSPLTRGKLRARVLQGHEGGLIPAHAGKTSSISPTSWPPWAHPRSRGENGCVRARRRRSRAHPRSRGENGGDGREGRHVLGSSPLTRGKPVHATPPCRDLRLIPAHAGKTRRESR